MIFDEIVDQAKARFTQFGVDFPSARSVLYRRIEIHQQELFTKASRANPDYFGVNACGDLDTSRRLDLKDLESAVGVDPASSITRVEICDKGTHPTLEDGDEVFVVSENDITAELAPRVSIRNFVIKAVGSDLDDVTSLCVHYGYRPENKTTPLDGSEVAELPDVFQEMLVVDLVKWMLKQTIDLSPEKKTAAIGVVQAEQEEQADTFLAEIADFAGAQHSRFGDVKGAQRV
jgi:hypothetical protein